HSSACLWRFFFQRHQQIHYLAWLRASIQGVPDLNEGRLISGPVMLGIDYPDLLRMLRKSSKSPWTSPIATTASCDCPAVLSGPAHIRPTKSKNIMVIKTRARWEERRVGGRNISCLL